MLVLGLQDVPEYTLPPATPTTLGGVIVPVDSGLVVDSKGNLGLNNSNLGDSITLGKVDSSVLSLDSSGQINLNSPSGFGSFIGVGVNGIKDIVVIEPIDSLYSPLDIKLKAEVRIPQIASQYGVRVQIQGEVQLSGTGNLTTTGTVQTNKLVVGGSEWNFSTVCVNSDGSTPIDLSDYPDSNSIFIRLTVDVDKLTVYLPPMETGDGPRIGRSVELTIMGNVTTLSVLNPTVPLLIAVNPIPFPAVVYGAPTSVIGYEAMKFRLAIFYQDNTAGYFRIA